MTETSEWNLSPREAVARQRELSSRIIETDRFQSIRRVAGIDAGFPDGGRTTRVAAVVMSYPGLEILEESVIERPTRFPYIPGLLSFREVPVMLEAVSALEHTPDVVLCDGHGRAHPRRFGSACHFGLLSGIASVGVGKSRLYGAFEDPGRERGDRCDLMDGDACIGAVVRTRRRVKPVFVSLGHAISLESAVDLVLDCAPRFRLPEPIRAADKLAARP